MKNLIISIAYMLLLMVPWGIYHSFSDASTGRFQNIIADQIIPAAQAQDWQRAEDGFRLLQTDWNSFKRVSAYFIDTRSIDEITEHMERASCYIQQQDAANAVVEAANLQHKLKTLHENDTPSVSSLF